MRRNKKQSLWFRTYSNWRKYKAYINKYRGVRDDLVHDLLRKTVDHGFNHGVEMFELKVNKDDWYEREKKKFQLENYARMKPVTIEDMAVEKAKMEKAAEEAKTYKYDPNWKPTFEEITSSNYEIVHQYYISPKMYFRIYKAHDKLVHVGVSVVPGVQPLVVVKEDYRTINEIVGGIFRSFDPKLGEEVEEQPEPEVNIDHVKKAMGQDNKKQNKRLNDLLDDIF